MILLVVAAVCFGLVALAWVVYPLAMRLAAGRPAAAPPAGPATERVTVVVATRDDPAMALARVRNLRSSSYPAGLLDVVVAVDRNAPHALDAYRAALGSSASVVPGDPAGGKAANLNAGVRHGRGADVLVFADVGQEFSEDAITRMVQVLRDERFGGVAGRYTQHREDRVMAAYASLEAVIRAGQARRHSVVSTSGSIYAIRASLWRELPPGLICDDLFTTLSVVRQGKRVGFCADAVAFDPRSFTRDQQFVRRVRTLTGLIQYVMLEPRVLLPWHNPVWVHFVLHKLLRLLTPIPLAIGVAAALAWGALQAPRLLAGAVLAALFGLLALRLLLPRRTAALAGQVLWILRLQLVPGFAIANGLRRRWTVWTPTPQGNGRHAGAGA